MHASSEKCFSSEALYFCEGTDPRNACFSDILNGRRRAMAAIILIIAILFLLSMGRGSGNAKEDKKFEKDLDEFEEMMYMGVFDDDDEL
jgi:hypothetical protein